LRTSIDTILEKALSGSRLSLQDGLALCAQNDLVKLGAAAHQRRLAKTDPSLATYIIDRNVNYSNVCVLTCDFCAFYRIEADADSYVLSREELDEKIEVTKAQGGTQVLMQGGLHPKLPLSFYTDLLRYLKDRHHIHLHAFSPPEIKHFARISKHSFREVLRQLHDAGLDSVPGGGAEILVDRVRTLLSPGKCTSDEWLQIMEDAHAVGMKTTATMMFGHVETHQERIEHLIRLRDLQDRTGGFVAFIPWTYQFKPQPHGFKEFRRNGKEGRRRNNLADVQMVGAFEYLRMLAISRLMLDNFNNVQSSWLTQGHKIGQAGLRFGANDLGSIMIEENVVRQAGVTNTITTPEMRRIITDAGFTPRQRDMYYRLVPEAHPETALVGATSGHTQPWES
jgi:cyclic dehypoxanthinyl futalosine synthase